MSWNKIIGVVLFAIILAVGYWLKQKGMQEKEIITNNQIKLK